MGHADSTVNHNAYFVLVANHGFTTNARSWAKTTSLSSPRRTCPSPVLLAWRVKSASPILTMLLWYAWRRYVLHIYFIQYLHFKFCPLSFNKHIFFYIHSSMKQFSWRMRGRLVWMRYLFLGQNGMILIKLAINFRRTLHVYGIYKWTLIIFLIRG